MITPKEILSKAEKQFHEIVSALLNEDNPFPLVIPSNKQLIETDYAAIVKATIPLHQHSKDIIKHSYSIEWKEKIIKGTKQKLPAKIFFETLEDFLVYTKKRNDFDAITNTYNLLTNTFPIFKVWAKDNTSFLLNIADELPNLLKVCAFFYENNPPYNLYLRELPIQVHSKFIEENTIALKKLLDILLPETKINLLNNNFSERYFVKSTSPYIRIRVLDKTLENEVGFEELALPIEITAKLVWQPQKVFIIENEACFLSFPKVNNAVAIWGEGFKSRLSKKLPWLNDAEVFCWFDLDPAGFEMLNIIRQYYPNAKSFLMDEVTYNCFKEFAYTTTYRKIQLDKLTIKELNLYEFLQSNGLRLEHERITNEYILNHLKLKGFIQ